MKVMFQTNRKLILAIVLLTVFFGFAPIFDKSNTMTEENGSEFDVAASMASQFGPAVTPGQTLTTADMTTTTPKIPSDIYRPSGTVGPVHEDLATFAWLEFISLVSPKGNVRGESGGSFETSGKNPSETLVWESFQHRSELFPYTGNSDVRPPDPWDQTPTYKMFYTDSDTVQQMVDIPFHNYNNLDETTQIGMNIIYFPIDPNTMNPESDFEILFEAKVNQQEWKFVNDNYKKFGDLYGSYPDGISLYPGTIEVKATWRPLASIAANEQYRYHTASAIWYKGEDDDPEADVGTYALIGLHIIHKTPNFPSFIFATFEHTDNLRTAAGKPTGLYYVPSYDTIQYSLPPTTKTKHPSETVNNPAYPSDWLSAPYAEPSPGVVIDLPHGLVTSIANSKTIPVKGGAVVGVPVTQPATTNPAVAKVNGQALAAMRGIPGFGPNFVWQYYFLKGVQGVPSDDEMSPDYYLANIVTESSVPGIQLFTGGQSNGGKKLSIPRNQTNTRDLPQTVPGVAQRANTTISRSIPSGLKLSSYDGPDSPSPSKLTNNSPVLIWNGYTYWPLSYIDNRVSMGITAYDAFGNAVNTLEVKGARYVWMITVDEAKKTVTFHGQANKTATATFAQLDFDGSTPRTVFNQGGCQGCHGIAQTNNGFDFSFLYFNRTSGFSPEVHGLTSAELTQLRIDKYQKMFSSSK